MAHVARAQTVRSADIAQKNLHLNREVFEHAKTKDASAAAATGANSRGRSNPSHSGSDSDHVDSGVGGSSSKSTSVRTSQGRIKFPSAVLTLAVGVSPRHIKAHGQGALLKIFYP